MCPFSQPHLTDGNIEAQEGRNACGAETLDLSSVSGVGITDFFHSLDLEFKRG